MSSGVRALALTLLLTAAGCGLIDSPKYPDVSGTYTIEVRFDQTVLDNLNGSGELIIDQRNRDEPNLYGGTVLTVRWTRPIGAFESHYNQYFTAGTVTEDGSVRFLVDVSGRYWEFTAAPTAEGFTGRHTLPEAWSGTWTAIRK